VRTGRFREDLYYRLNVVPIRLPALRERRADIPALAHLFVERFARRHNLPIQGIDPAAEQVLCAYAWPGNIRELENAIERAVLLSEGCRIGLADLPPEMSGPAGSTAPTPSASSAPLRDRIRDATRMIEREAIEEALRATNGNVTQAARRLGLSRRGLQLKMKELEIGRADE
jgi:two-component system response regulator AtoC